MKGNMPFIIAKKGARTSKSKIFISAKAKTISFSAGFFRADNIKLNSTNYARIAFDQVKKEIAFEFSELQKNSNEFLKLTKTTAKTAASCSVNPILSTFPIKISEIAGTYQGEAIMGPLKISGFSDNGYILKLPLREI